MVAGLHLGQSCHCRPREARPRKSVKSLLHHANWRAGQQCASWANHEVSGRRTGLDWRVDAATIVRERKVAYTATVGSCSASGVFPQLLAWWYYATPLGQDKRAQFTSEGSLLHSRARGRRRESPRGC
ncbi:hypothetical protein LLEC1_05833 [Akanthomyces lecanii]|uniref:Uncharacterized protein n=1 Tax=Cordyceps confragosa TaxID=2714763 RepID=A0A179I8T8_CORDF|nr:hypothetical protein LLEC1_05833 [Akanthomyces lecanii]